MARPSMRLLRRAQLIAAFVRVLGRHGQAGATVARIAHEAGMAPGLVHHHFASKDDLYDELLTQLIAGFRARLEAAHASGADALDAYADTALALGERADVDAARAWVGLFGEALTRPALHARVRRILDAEVARVEARGAGRLSTADASAVVAFVLGALVFGAFAPRRTAGFAAPALRRLMRALREPLSSRGS